MRVCICKVLVCNVCVFVGVCVCLTTGLEQGQGLEVSSQQYIMQVSVAAVEGDVHHIPDHDVLHTNIILPEGR